MSTLSKQAARILVDAPRVVPARDGMLDSRRSSSGPSCEVRTGFDSTSERRRVFDWLGGGLRPSNPEDLIREYPLVLGGGAASHFFTLWQDGLPAAFCCLWEAPFRIGRHPLRTGMISFVYTDPGLRGRGFARSVLEAAIEQAMDLDLGLILLWSDLEPLYSPLGFVRAGVESMLVLDSATVEKALSTAPSSKASAAPAIAIDTPDAADWLAIERIRSDRTCGLDWPPGALARFQSIPNMNVRVARSERGVEAFAIQGRGDDFAEVIHEWGGETHAALLCCQTLLTACEPWNQLLLITPLAPDPLPWALRRAGARQIRQPLCWMRIASSSAFAQDLSALLGHSIVIEESEPAPSVSAGNSRLIKTPRAELQLSDAVLLEALFGSVKPSPAETTAAAQLMPVDGGETGPLPLAFFVWGLESI